MKRKPQQKSNKNWTP